MNVHLARWIPRLVLVPMLALCAACGTEADTDPAVDPAVDRAASGRDGAAAASAARSGVGGNPPAAPVPVPVSTDADVPRGLAGTWWLLAPDLSYLAFRLDLNASSLDGHFGGQWRSFDWRGTPREQAPYRVSRPVAVQARRSGTELVVQGPAPQLDLEGHPNGANGAWTATLVRRSAADGSSQWRGTLVHLSPPGTLALTPPTGIDVELTRAFRMWEP